MLLSRIIDMDVTVWLPATGTALFLGIAFGWTIRGMAEFKPFETNHWISVCIGALGAFISGCQITPVHPQTGSLFSDSPDRLTAKT